MKQITKDAIEVMRAAKVDVSKAEAKLTTGVEAQAAGKFVAAYDCYLEAYRLLLAKE